MWISRTDWTELLGAKAQLEFYKERLRVSEERERQDALESVTLRARVAELEAGIVKLNDELVRQRRAQADMPTRINLSTIFDEDEDVVKRDQEFIRKEGTSDPLLAAETDE